MKKALYFIFLLLISLVVLGFTRSWYQYQELSQTQVNSSQGIDRLFYVNIRGNKTAVLARGNDLSNPILLMVHGGPGYPDMMLSRCFDQGLLDEFTVVRYDQRGTGKSKNGELLLSKLTIGNFTEDLLALTDAMKQHIPNVDVYLLGHSWGTVLGLKAAYQAPEKYKAYIGMGQIVNEQRGDKISYQYTLDKAREAKEEGIVAELLALNPDTYSKVRGQLIKQRKYLKKFGGSSHKAELMDKLKYCAIRSPEMSLTELLRYQGKGSHVEELMFPQLFDLDFFEQIPAVKVPLYLFGGRYDYHVPSTLAEQYLNQVEAEKKEFVWFEASGHMPIYEENEKFVEELIRIKRENE